MALKRLAEEVDELDFLSEQDRRICAHLRREDNWGYYSGKYEFEREGALLALVGHPLIFWARRGQSAVELVATQPELQKAWLDLDWTPREPNAFADALSNGQCEGFDPSLRILASFSTLSFETLVPLLKSG